MPLKNGCADFPLDMRTSNQRRWVFWPMPSVRIEIGRRLNQLHDVCSRDGPPAYRVASSRRCAADYFLVLGSSAGLT